MQEIFSFEGAFCDSRNCQIGDLIINSMLSKSSSIIHRIAGSRSREVKFYRFVKNPKVLRSEMEEAYYDYTHRQVAGKEVVIIQDTTELNYESFRDQLDENDTDLGPVGNGRDIGFFNHCSLVIDAQENLPIGFSDIQLYNRKFGDEKSPYKNRPIEEKESYRWIRAMEHSKEVCSHASIRWFVSDRESDIYYMYDKVQEPDNHFVIRAAQNRLVDSDSKGDRLFQYISAQDIIGEYNLEVNDPKTAEKQVLNIAVKAGRVKVKRPAKGDKDLVEFVEMSFVEARSIESKRIHWVLLTDVEINSVADALKIVERYKQRWHIEVFFGLLKSKGLNVELSQFTVGDNLKTICLLAMKAALRINQLRLAFKHKDCQTPASAFFDKQEVKILIRLNGQYEGKTEKQKNPFNKKSVAWAAWIMARMGGWKSYFSQHDPGIATFTRGYMELCTLHKYSIVK